MKRLGVYICHCGGNISDYVDVEEVRKAVEHEEGVVLAKTTMFACSDFNQNDMVSDIKKHKLDGVVVASCSPKLHLVTFRNVTERGDLNKYTYVHANIREQASWAHSDDKQGATGKAIHLVKAAIAKSRYAEPLYPNQIEAEKTIAVIGAGIAGLKAAASISDKNINVILIEKENRVGGHAAELGDLFMSDEKGYDIVNRVYNDIVQRENVTILTGSEVISSKGSIGDFTLKIRKRPQNAGDPVETMEIKVGSMVVATGFESYIPKEGEFDYVVNENVIALPEFKLLVDKSTGDRLIYKGKTIKNIVYIYCVGSRQNEGGNTYCSRFCCTSVIHTSIEAKKKFKNIYNIHLNRGIRTYGKQELLYAESLKMGDIYLQFDQTTPPEITSNGKNSIVTVTDILSEGKKCRLKQILSYLSPVWFPAQINLSEQCLRFPKAEINSITRYI